jgi:hypothetical protein
VARYRSGGTLGIETASLTVNRKKACKRTAHLLLVWSRLEELATLRVCLGLTASYLTPATSPLYYLTGLTSLLESIALIIDQHQPVVEKYYGTGRMRAVIGRLQAEGDRVVRNLIEGWEEERRVGRLVSSQTLGVSS